MKMAVTLVGKHPLEPFELLSLWPRKIISQRDKVQAFEPNEVVFDTAAKWKCLIFRRKKFLQFYIEKPREKFLLRKTKGKKNTRENQGKILKKFYLGNQ